MRAPLDLGSKPQGLVFNVQRFSVHDGPGIRSLVFMKGCPLRCVWCSNPESQNRYPEIAYLPERCIGPKECGACVEVCSSGATMVTERWDLELNRQLCTTCGECVRVCPTRARRLYGELVSTSDLADTLEEDSAFYWRSGGGVTVGGGEPLFQADFVSQLLKECQSRGIETAIETCGYAGWEQLRSLLRHTNLVLYDVKHMDSIKHKAFTGVPNDLILQNLVTLGSAFPELPVIVRTPVVPGLTDSEENIRSTAIFVSSIRNLKAYELLPYHGFGGPKYSQLGRVYPLRDLLPPSAEHMASLRRIAQEFTSVREPQAQLSVPCAPMSKP